MASTTQDSQKVQHRKLQKFYSAYLSVALVLFGVLVILWLLSLFSIVRIDTEIGILISFVLLAAFAPLSIILKSKNKNRSLKTPPFISEKRLTFIGRATMVFFVLVLAYGLLAYPAAPIKQDGVAFTDKAGQEYSYTEFLTFKKWELTLIFSWGFALLQGAVLLPYLGNRANKWWKL